VALPDWLPEKVGNLGEGAMAVEGAVLWRRASLFALQEAVTEGGIVSAMKMRRSLLDG
jgi:hypothetical protein